MGGDHKPCFRHSRPSLFLKFTSCSESRCTFRQEGHPSNSARAAHQYAANAGLHLLLLLLFPRRRSNNKGRCRNVDSVAFFGHPDWANEDPLKVHPRKSSIRAHTFGIFAAVTLFGLSNGQCSSPTSTCIL